MPAVDWKLAQSLTSDGQGIRSVCVLPPQDGDAYTLITGNQAGRTCAFGVPSGRLQQIDYQHNHAVTALCAAPDGSYYVSGCKDHQIRIFSSNDHTLLATLEGHTQPVTSLSWCPDGMHLVSGSWDGTAKVWNVPKRSMVATLPNHENSVSVVGLDQDAHTIRIATGSAGVAQGNTVKDYAIRLWTVDTNTGQVTLVKTVANDHHGPIRDVALAGDYLVSCSNDGTCKVRSWDDAHVITTLDSVGMSQQHPPMLLSVTAVDKCVVACAEDGQVVVFHDMDNAEPQVIRHAVCVWKVLALPNGDFCTSCDDGTVRIFTRAQERMALESERQAFSNDVAQALQQQQSGPSSDEIAKLPRWENQTQHRGTSEGQVQVFSKNGIAIAAQWSAASQTWIEVGQVMGQREGNTINGQSYDHVLPIEVDQTGGGVANLQIGYNDGENPFVAAQRFIDEHMLPQYHLAEIADYIQQRVGRPGPTLGAESAISTAMTGMPIASFDYLPAPAYLSLELPAATADATLQKISAKISESGQLSEEQLQQLSSLIETLVATNRYHSSKVTNAQLAVIQTMLETLAADQVFPALDLARLVVLHPDAASLARATYWTGVIQQALQRLQQAAAANDRSPAIPMLSLRLFANAFKGGPGSCQAVAMSMDQVLASLQPFVSSSNKNIRLAVATVLHNACRYLQQQSDGIAGSAPTLMILPLIRDILSSKAYQAEAMVRTLVALGTLVLSSPEAKDAANGLHLASMVEPAASPHGDKAKAVAKEVYAVLQQ